jgi:A-factor type gamma-butyrolactone 1'-reductase (1S-forming)
MLSKIVWATICMTLVLLCALVHRIDCVESEQNDAKVDIRNRVILVTGASSGIGEAAARHWASQGAKVLLAARRMHLLEAISDQLNRDYLHEDDERSAVAVPFRCDVTSEQDVRQAFEHAFDVFGAPVDFVFANAGIAGQQSPFAEKVGKSDDVAGQRDLERDGEDLLAEGLNDSESMRAMRHLFDVNVFGYYRTLRQAVLHWRRHGVASPAIAFSSSILGAAPRDIVGAHGDAVFSLGYSVAKAAINQLVRAAQGAYGGEPDRVRALSVGIAVFRSEILDGHDAAAIAQFINPLFPGQVGDPVRVAEAVGHFFAGTSGWQPGDNIVTDNDATFSAHWNYAASERSGHWSVPRDQAFDVSGTRKRFESVANDNKDEL